MPDPTPSPAVEPAPDPIWRSRIVGTAEVPVESILANPDNWRIHPKEQQDALLDSLNRRGWLRAIIINATTDRLVDGHLRVILADRHGATVVPATLVNLSPDEEREALLTFDPLGDLAVAERPKLEALLGLTGLGEHERALLASQLPSASAERRPTPPAVVPPPAEGAEGSAAAAAPQDYLAGMIYRIVLPYQAGPECEHLFSALDTLAGALGAHTHTEVVTRLLRHRFRQEPAA